MRLDFTVGVYERHQVCFSFDKVWGRLSITVDAVPVTKELRMFSVSLSKRYEFVVGVQERHQVVIEKTRPLLFAGLRAQPCRAYVDGVLVAENVA